MSWYVDKKARQEARPSTKVCYFIMPARQICSRAPREAEILHWFFESQLAPCWPAEKVKSAARITREKKNPRICKRERFDGGNPRPRAQRDIRLDRYYIFHATEAESILWP
jgi:hypothetical protein